jgi:signal transduction histidine kinase
VNIDVWLNKAITSLSPLTKRHGIEVHGQVPSPIQCTIAAGELEQVVSNLIVNAVMHAFPDEYLQKMEDSPRVDVQVVARETMVRIEVIDNGRGMSPEEFKQVFEPFFTTKRGLGGTGLGMHIVHQIIHERFEGSISGKTAPGQGTTWVIQIPHPTVALVIDRT